MILAECTVNWAEQHINPTDAYLNFMQRLGSHANQYATYLSTAITAGGFKRNANLSGREVVAANTDVALRYADELARHDLINLETSIDAVSLGYIPHWAQSDYLEFWFHVMARPNFSMDPCRNAEREYYEVGITAFKKSHDMELFSSQQASHDERRPLYLDFADTYTSGIYPVRKRPVKSVVQLIDREMSLGADAEARLSRHLGIPVTAPAQRTYANMLDDSVVHNLDLLEKLQRLRDIGATVCSATHPSELILARIA